MVTVIAGTDASIQGERATDDLRLEGVLGGRDLAALGTLLFSIMVSTESRARLAIDFSTMSRMRNESQMQTHFCVRMSARRW